MKYFASCSFGKDSIATVLLAIENNEPLDGILFNEIVFDHKRNISGRLLPSWEDDIRQGFEECMRVLKPNGTLIFKWNEQQIPTARIIEIIGQKPLFGHTSGKGGKTIWMCFLKNE